MWAEDETGKEGWTGISRQRGDMFVKEVSSTSLFTIAFTSDDVRFNHDITSKDGVLYEVSALRAHYH